MTCPTLGPGLLVALNGVNAQSWLANLNVLNGLNAASGYGIFNPATKPFERFARVRLNGFSSRQRIESTRKFIQATKLRDYSTVVSLINKSLPSISNTTLQRHSLSISTVLPVRQLRGWSRPFIYVTHSCQTYQVLLSVGNSVSYSRLNTRGFDIGTQAFPASPVYHGPAGDLFLPNIGCVISRLHTI